MSNGNYTWESVMLGIDVENEATAKQKKQKEIDEMRAKEQDAMSLWSLGLSVLGGAIFGPVGYFVGKQLGTYGADRHYDWESEEMDIGKFDRQTARDYNELLDKAADDQNTAQLISGLTDLATMYVQAGGLEEGFDPSIGGGDWTTFGTGDDAWTVFGDESFVGKGIKIPGTDKRIGLPFVDAKTLPGEQALFTGKGAPIWQKGGLKQLQSNLFKGGNLRDAYLQTTSPIERLLFSGREEPLPEGEEVASSDMGWRV